MIDSRCGLRCTGCSWKQSHGCGGCGETQGHPFHGECPVAQCSIAKGLRHCGECPEIPCGKLYAYSYLDPEHGDRPQGARVAACREWAAAEGIQAWDKVLLTSAGFEGLGKRQRPQIVQAFRAMLGKPVSEARILFIPAAALDEEAKAMAQWCYDELVRIGVDTGRIVSYGLDGRLSAGEALTYDAVYFTGGDTAHLLKRIRETGFDLVVKRMVYAGKVYVGVSAGSLIATPNIGDPYDEDRAGLCLVNAYLSVHCKPGTPPRADLPLPHLPLTDSQALVVRWDGYQVIEN